MRSRRSRPADDSFDLFLDTITNTFGGVLLIALLIVLMIRENKHSAPEEYQTGPSEDAQVVQSAITALEAEKITLAASLQVQQQYNQDFQSDDQKNLAQKLAQQLTEKNELENAAAKLSLAAKQVVQSQQGLETTKQDLQESLGMKKAEYEELNRQLAAEQAARTRTMALPKERATTKTEVAIILANHQMFIVNANKNGGGYVKNSKHFEVSSRTSADLHIDSEFLKIKSGEGIDIASEGMKRELSEYKSSKFFFTFVARSNSFESFSKIREECVSNGYEYRIIATDGIVGESQGARPKTQ